MVVMTRTGVDQSDLPDTSSVPPTSHENPSTGFQLRSLISDVTDSLFTISETEAISEDNSAARFHATSNGASSLEKIPGERSAFSFHGSPGDQRPTVPNQFFSTIDVEEPNNGAETDESLASRIRSAFSIHEQIQGDDSPKPPKRVLD